MGWVAVIRTRLMFSLVLLGSCGEAENFPSCENPEALVQRIEMYARESLGRIERVGYRQFHEEQKARQKWYEELDQQVLECVMATELRGATNERLAHVSASFQYLYVQFRLDMDSSSEAEIGAHRELVERELRLLLSKGSESR